MKPNNPENRPQLIAPNGEPIPVPEFYTNSVLINVSPFEVELQNMLVDSSQNLKGAISVRMSPQTAWTLSKALAKNLADYEARFGEIALPAEIKKQFD